MVSEITLENQHEYAMKLVSREPVQRSIVSVFLYFIVWYSFNIIYNIYTKPALAELPLPACITFCQLCIGSLFVLFIWQFKPIGINEAMKGKTSKFVAIAVCHAIGSWGTQLSFHVGTVGFTNVLKSGEPLFSALFSFIFMSKVFSWKVYGSLIVIIIGISLASVDEMSFSWIGFIACNIANCFYPLRMVLSKLMMSGDELINPSFILAEDLFRIITVIATVSIIPLCLLELLNSNITIHDTWNKLTSSSELAQNIFLSGSAYYIYNEVFFIFLMKPHFFLCFHLCIYCQFLLFYLLC